MRRRAGISGAGAGRLLQWGSFALGFTLLGAWIGTASRAWWYQTSESRKLEARVGSVASASGGTLGRLEIPRLGIGAMIAEGVDPRVLDLAVGHVRHTARVGDPGNVALAGHRDTFFRGLGRLRPDDEIRIVTPERTFTYRVRWKAVLEPDRVEVLDSTATRSLTLVTCYPFSWIGPAPKRFVVRAEEQDPAAEPALQ